MTQRYPNGKTFIIAEAGVNHNGDLDIAKKLIDTAASAGVDAVKFQSFHAESIVTPTAIKAEYQKNNCPREQYQFDMLKRLELNESAHKKLNEYCRSKNIMFMSSPFDIQSIDFLDELGMEIFKIPSGEIVNLPYLIKVGSLGKKVIMSTGMACMDEIKNALVALESAGTDRENIIVLHCTTEYPAREDNVNLLAMLMIRDSFNVKVGYSDHTLGIEVPIAATAMGASVLEKHFTLSREMEGPDQKSSLEPEELKDMVKAVRKVEKFLGNGLKTPTQGELINRTIVRKSIVASRPIKKGEAFSEKNITSKRPGTGISPMMWNDVLGRKALRDFSKDEMIEL